MATAWAELTEQGGRHELAKSHWLLEHLLQAEATDRAMRSIRHQMSAARFPMHRDLAGFDFEASPVDEALIGRLATLEFTEAAHNVVLVGGPGTGKTHLATALGIAGITEQGKRVRFHSTVDLVNALEQEKVLISALQPKWRCFAVSPAQPALRAHQRRDHHQPGLRRVEHGVWRREDDDGTAGSAHAPLPHRGNGQ
ncbi:hypothetical protein P606_26305 [Comamonas thiooxydans]|nr:hypothetical protein P606_26305 [Comamonas thiooxydans]